MFMTQVAQVRARYINSELSIRAQEAYQELLLAGRARREAVHCLSRDAMSHAPQSPAVKRSEQKPHVLMWDVILQSVNEVVKAQFVQFAIAACFKQLPLAPAVAVYIAERFLTSVHQPRTA